MAPARTPNRRTRSDVATRNGLLAAWGLFTVLPAPVVAEVDERLAVRAIASMPWVGLGLGLIAGLGCAIVTVAGGGQPLAIAAGLAILALCTGFLHLDGLADTADGLGSRKPAHEALTIMRQSDIGPMGVTAIILVLALEIAAGGSGHLDGWRGVWLLVTMPMVARVSALSATGRWIPSAHKKGFGALFAGKTHPATIVVASVIAAVIAAGSGWLLFGWRAALVAVCACLASWVFGVAWRRHILARLGGLTGDTFGSLVEMSGLAYLLTLALFA
ncbi:Adenosylcobinamide-GDP ribazoletransferase [Propionibacterium freudenreichii]|uniref:Adenosylcobinamide-GDP ribazoletransferase n=1 Tax=Propionibacterium freudenreichii TaxID=1744 RepID=A0A2C7ZUA5_9ACTN|nr:Adenosylcobinamide-GDP ribazoletransferase [Propionibacterium freudenreichii subsp. freudenreichii]MCT2973904.1 adenosylcobinamide-GDP ribazoletransferase [Propionibacterium freudenreichii]SPB31214.1 Adenosylcobinamide-GDP ribazoletransferase [Propionibacterium freudenreichii subsp. shermanii]MCT2975694.1 adenosylcobinamide-GDP ribazoletransferase [Propionibacterium freudenreichii]MCT2977872.1 adenosylcobinamide-GDP ribazoletransferase [Propionibacterium freudenreichii]